MSKQRRAQAAKTDDKRQAVVHYIGAAVAQLSSQEAWAALLAQARGFARYSGRNQMLIFQQAPYATDVAGYRAWQQRGRQVRKGEAGIAILAPVTGKAPADDEAIAVNRDGDDGEGTGRQMRGCKVAFVFDITQTDPIEGAEQVPAPALGPVNIEALRAVVADIAGDDAALVLAALDGALA
jgi:N-terminal domain of anti-restriction factor ArdC